MKKDSTFFCFLSLRAGVAELWPHFTFPLQGVPLSLALFIAPEPDLVEKQPCSLNSSRTCECRPGLFCQMAVRDTCLRCQHHSACKPGFGVKIRGRNSLPGQFTFPGPGKRPRPDAFYLVSPQSLFLFRHRNK